jgi:hypothetical protein
MKTFPLAAIGLFSSIPKIDIDGSEAQVQSDVALTDGNDRNETKSQKS